MPQKLGNYIGQKIGRLTIVERAENYKDGSAQWYCDCDCGTKHIRVLGHSLNSGHTQSCGCWHRESVRRRMITHGLTDTRLHGIWVNMRARCNNPNAKFYERYGGRGISVSPEWNDFQAFYDWAMQNGYQADLELDRIDNDQGYSPDNCRWITHRDNANNRHDTRYVDYNNEHLAFADFARKYAPYIDIGTLYNRVFKYQWDIDRAINEPIQKKQRRKQQWVTTEQMAS